MIEINKIYNGDCLAGMAEIPSGGVDLIVTDPPYLINYSSSRRKNKKHRFRSPILNDDNKQLICDYMNECFRILKDNSAAYVFCSSKTMDFFMEQAREAGFKIKNVIIWYKNNHTAGDLKAQYGQCYEPILYLNKGRKEINGKRLEDVWKFNRVSGNRLIHQNQKPLPLIAQCIEKSSKEGDLVFDGFIGSGTTAVAAVRMNRNFIGYELDNGYFEKALQRVKRAKEENEIFII